MVLAISDIMDGIINRSSLKFQIHSFILRAFDLMVSFITHSLNSRLRDTEISQIVHVKRIRARRTRKQQNFLYVEISSESGKSQTHTI